MLLSRRTKKLAFSAVLTALSVVLLALAAVVPSGKLALCAAAGLLPAAAVISCGLSWGALVWVAASILAVLLVPQKGVVLVYVLLFGHYPVLKSLIERLNRPVLEWCVKLALYYALLAVCWFCFSGLMTQVAAFPQKFLWFCLLASGIVFVLYDLAFSKMIDLYIQRIFPYFK